MARPADRVSTGSLKHKFLNLSQTSLYNVRLIPPPQVSNFLSSQRGLNYTTEGRGLELLAYETTLPGSTFATHDVTGDFVGVTEKMAYRRIYDETIDMSFYVDKDYRIIEFFEGWVDFISNVGVIGNRDEKKTRASTMRMRYPKYYKTNISITKFEKDLSGRAMTYTFVDAFPISINNIPLSYDTSDVLRFSVSLSYVRYVREVHNAGGSVRTYDTGSTNDGDIVGVVNIGGGRYRVERLINGQIVSETTTSPPVSPGS